MDEIDKLINDIIKPRDRHRAGFKLLSLEVVKNPFLRNLKLSFCDSLKEQENYPFSTIIIGPNGTGKSNILRTTIDLFREIHHLINSKDGTRGNFVQGGFELTYILDGRKFSFGNLEYNDQNESIKDYHKKQKLWAKIDDYDEDFIETIKQFKLPEKVIANSIMVTDKYPYLVNDEFPQYKYLGVRSTRASSGTRAYVRKTVNIIQDSIKENQKNFIKKLSGILKFLELEERLIISYKPKYQTQFYHGQITEAEFRSYFEHQKDHFPKRTTDLWGTEHYKRIADNDNLILRIKDFLNSLHNRFLAGGENHIEYNVLKDKNLSDDFDLIRELSQLDLITYPSISLNKKGSHFDLEESSSGEYSLLSSLIGLMATVEDNSLVFIDEPEVSLHPNWQMKYMNYLKEIFQGFKKCHFIIATHSHFLISDIEGINSQIIGLRIEGEQIVPNHFSNWETYGWSAEEVLYKIFGVKTTRNYYLEMELRELLYKIAVNDKDKKGMNNIVSRLENFKFSESDPMNIIVQRAKKYLSK